MEASFVMIYMDDEEVWRVIDINSHESYYFDDEYTAIRFVQARLEK